jgi:hypothetical protein
MDFTGYLTQNEVKELVLYAKCNFVQIVPEIEGDIGIKLIIVFIIF